MSLDDRLCENCGRWIEANEMLYRVRLEVYAEPRIDFSDPLPPRSRARADWKELIARMEAMSEEEVREAADQVHELIEYNLCPECRRDLHRRIRVSKDVRNAPDE